ncbi:hypothetical protein BC332_24102 [Capsicum chinense]|uniref:Uncharacterized protein n=1 Tax=Capsicum annuum TaxID=4072 RepID=A0A2G2YT47_CAPAN|nr:hypothetical protein FXO38_25841 [Capsicum annuum]KAF3635082.1 hypothetical protein FXO37_26170 [Capsicum annuum]PHT72930.1 hypothetical protein T459_23715 [Capsicum annuum]PHU07613.1 hypothetical protein BC332_24102 [Capsicum chinense]
MFSQGRKFYIRLQGIYSHGDYEFNKIWLTLDLCCSSITYSPSEDINMQDAARFRDELKNIAPHSLLKCSSDATTLVSPKAPPIRDSVKAISRSQAKYYIKTSDINISTYGLLSHMARNKLKLI